MPLAEDKTPNGYRTALWTALTTAAPSTAVAYTMPGRATAASIVIAGTFGGATVTMLGSNDGTNYAPIKDIFGGALAATTATTFRIPFQYRKLKPLLTGGTADSVLVSMLVYE